MPASPDALVADVGDGEDPANVQLGEPVPLVVGMGIVGDRPTRSSVVMVADMTNRGGKGDHRPVA